MKSKIILAAALAVLVSLYGANALVSLDSCTQKSSCEAKDIIYIPDGMENCASMTNTCYDCSNLTTITDSIYNGYRTCDSCNSGYVLSLDFVKIGTLRYTVYGCAGNCTVDNCDNAKTTDWSKTLRMGYESRTVASCSDNYTCTTRTQYRCAAGYYGSSSTGTSGCSMCPVAFSVDGDYIVISTSAAGSTKITDCYSTGGSDSTGSYTYTSNCYYSE